MIDAQVARQLKSLIGARSWPLGSASSVVQTAGVVITTLQPEDLVGNIQEPFVIIGVGTGTADPTRPGLMRTNFEITTVQKTEGDEVAEAPMIGSGRVNIGQSEGQGVLVVHSQVMQAVNFKTAANGLPKFTLVRSTGAAPLFVGRTYYAMAKTVVSTTCTVAETYQEPGQFLAADATGGDATLTWKNPPSRYDFYQVRVQRAAGATAPATSTAGTNVYSGALETYTDSPTSGQFSYSIWAAYDETNTYDGGTASAEQKYSEQVTGTTSTVTVT